MSTDTSPNSTAPEQGQAKGSIVIDGISYIPSSALLTGIPKISFKDNRAFGVVDAQGEAPRLYASGSELGIYFNDTRYLDVWEMTFNGQSTVSLSSELRFSGNTVVFSMTNRDFPRIGGLGRIVRDTFLIRRILTLEEDALYETVEIKNYSHEKHMLQIEQWAGSRFDDLFEVRGFARAKRGKMLAPEEADHQGHRMTILRYEGLDQQVRKLFLHRLFDAEKIRVSPGLVGYFTRVEIEPKGSVHLKTILSFDRPTHGKFKGEPYAALSVADKMRLLAKEEHSKLIPLTIESDHGILNRSIEYAQRDIYMLLTKEASKEIYPYAGVPWYSAAFGRDGITTAYQMLPWYPDLARGVLSYVFQILGTKSDPFTDEQPGKVFHEMRHGEMAHTREVPFIPYYGSVDATPLSLILLHEYIRWTMDLDSLRDWWPDALKALEWVEKWGDMDGDGFLEYARQSTHGLVNQGWKDSGDSVMHADGRLAEAPIRLCEVQGYAFRARMGMSALAQLLGQGELAARLRFDALQLKARFRENYWDPVKKIIYLALDKDRAACAVRSSNMGHCLWSQILQQDEAREIGRHLMSDKMFSGHGIRTLASDETSYNPLSYHNGSIWPHDNSIIMEGFRYYGLTKELEQVSMGMLGVLESSDDFRLPELFCGFRKRGKEPPVPYEVACKPQAWAAGSVFLMLKSMLGLSMDIDQNYIVCNAPLLTPLINRLEIRGLRGRDWEMDLGFRRTGAGTFVDVLRKTGPVKVLTVRY